LFVRAAADNAWDKILAKTFPPQLEDALRSMFSETECIERREFTVLHKIVLGLVNSNLEIELDASTAEIDATDSNNRTAVSLAAERGDLISLKLLLQHGANIRIASTSLSTPLHFAVCNPQPHCIDLLITEGADPNALTNHNQTPLIYAAAYTKDVRHAKLLLDHGAIVDFPDLDGITALGWTAISGNTPVAMLLLQEGANVDIIDNSGHTCLSRSISGNHHDIISALVAKGAKTETRLPSGFTLMHIVAEKADLQSMYLLQRLGTRPSSRGEDPAVNMVLQTLRARPDYSASMETCFSSIGQARDEIEEDDEWHDACEE
jgi:ankyrin repeat protein